MPISGMVFAHGRVQQGLACIQFKLDHIHYDFLAMITEQENATSTDNILQNPLLSPHTKSGLQNTWPILNSSQRLHTHIR